MKDFYQICPSFSKKIHSLIYETFPQSPQKIRTTDAVDRLQSKLKSILTHAVIWEHTGNDQDAFPNGKPPLGDYDKAIAAILPDMSKQCGKGEVTNILNQLPCFPGPAENLTTFIEGAFMTDYDMKDIYEAVKTVRDHPGNKNLLKAFADPFFKATAYYGGDLKTSGSCARGMESCIAYRDSDDRCGMRDNHCYCSDEKMVDLGYTGDRVGNHYCALRGRDGDVGLFTRYAIHLDGSYAKAHIQSNPMFAGYKHYYASSGCPGDSDYPIHKLEDSRDDFTLASTARFTFKEHGFPSSFPCTCRPGFHWQKWGQKCVESPVKWVVYEIKEVGFLEMGRVS